MPVGLDVADYVIILLDWDGRVPQERPTCRGRRQESPSSTLIDDQGSAARSLSGQKT